MIRNRQANEDQTARQVMINLDRSISILPRACEAFSPDRKQIVGIDDNTIVV